jgi:hypothetical protein
MHSMKKIVFFLSILMIAASTEAQTITINPLTQLTYCEGETAAVSYRSTGSFDPSNVFVVQLSAPGGSFSGWSIIGRASADSGSILVTFTQAGTYRLRIASTNPGMFSSDSGAEFYVAGPPVPNAVAWLPWTVGTQYPSPMSIEASNNGNNFVGVQYDTLHIFDQYDDSAVRHEWIFNQDANISSSTLANPTVVWASGGTKTGSVRTWNSEGCTDTASLSIELMSCDPIIPANAHIVTETETGNYNNVWVKPGGVYTGGANNVFVESGGEFSTSGGSSETPEVFVKRGASLVISQATVDIAVLDTAASLSDNGFVDDLLRCDSLQFDYSLIQPSGVEITPPSNITILQSGDHLFANDEGLPIEICVSNILGSEVLSQGGNGALDIDLSPLPAGVYFAVVQAGSEREVQKIAVVH